MGVFAGDGGYRAIFKGSVGAYGIYGLVDSIGYRNPVLVGYRKFWEEKIMIKVNQLKGIIAASGMSQRGLAAKMGITDKTFYAKMKQGVFNSDEIMKMIDILGIEDVVGVFFAKEVQE